MFVSTAKITFPGSGISAFISSKRNVERALSHINYQTISYDKINQLRHVRFFGSADGVREQMKKHASILYPKFKIVLDTLDGELGDLDIARWRRPNGGYFVSFYAIGELCKSAGVTLTNVGATYPYGVDPDDSNIRIAPSYPTCEELKAAMDVFVICARLAAAEKLINK
jgi:DNA-binding transcriptional MocR family regulator